MQTSEKIACNTSINKLILNQAKAFSISPSQVLEEALLEKIKQKKELQWLEKNQEAIKKNNEELEIQGCTLAENIGQM
ncbi:MAG: type II toxin-antitoxin system CcdA family antitoxin [Alteromonadaceae bacterium]|nr:type II toxin-antitoxin system CcdA family antitoxin [Alteromonadaceae bacterium]